MQFFFPQASKAQKYSGFDWIHHIGTADDEVIWTWTNDAQGNIYFCGNFKVRVIIGTDTLYSQDPSTESIFVAKYGSDGTYKWAKRLSVNQPTFVSTISDLRIAVSQNGSVSIACYIKRGAIGTDFLATLRNDGSSVYAKETQFVDYESIVKDKTDNIYYHKGHSWLGSFDSLGNDRWGYYITQSPSSHFDIKKIAIVNDTLYVLGELKDQVTFSDTLGTTPITIYGNNWDLFLAKYSKNGKLLSVHHRDSLLTSPIYTGVHTYGISATGNVYVTTVKEPQSNVSDIYLTKYSPTLTVLNNHTRSFATSLVAGVGHFAYVNSYKDYCVSEAVGFSFDYPHLFIYNQSLALTDSADIPTALAFPTTPIETRTFLLDSFDNIYIQSIFNDTLTYADGSGSKTFINVAGSKDMFFGRYHKCQSYSPAINQSGNTISCSLPGMNYQWLLNGSPISGATGQSFIPTVSGNYSVRVSDGWNCFATSSQIPITVGIYEIGKDNAVFMFPNPVSSKLKITGLPEHSQIMILSTTGKVLQETFSKKETILDLSAFPTGMYIIKTEQGAGKIWKE